MKKLNIRLLRLIKNSRGQVISTVGIVALAIIVYVSMSMMSDNLYDSIYQYYDITNFGDVLIEVTKIPRAGVEKLHNIEGVKMVQGRISSDVPLRVEDPEERVRVRIVSLPNEEDIINNIYTIDGSGPQGKGKSVAVLQQFADARDIKLGDRIVAYIGGRDYTLDVGGIVGSPEYIYLMENEEALLPAPESFGVVYVTEDFAQSVLDYQGSYNELMIKIDGRYFERLDSIIETLEEELDKYGVKRSIKREDQLSHSLMMQEVDQLKTMSRAITSIFLLVTMVIISIMLSRLVRNDRISIGVMKAIGYSNGEVLSHYIKFALFIGLVGSIIGILVSLPVSIGLTKLFIVFMNIPMLKTKVYYRYIVQGILLISFFSCLSGLIGSRDVLKIMPADAMRLEPPKTGGRICLEGVGFFWTRLSFSWKMVIRNIFRNRRRSAFLVLGIALTFGVIMVPVFMSNVWNNMFKLQYEEFQTMDYNIDFTRPMDIGVLREIGQMIDVDYMEAKMEMPLELRYGWNKKIVNVIGITGNTQFYNFENISGGRVNLSEDGMLIPKRLANILGVGVGDVIQAKNFLPNKEDTYIEVGGIIEQYSGMNAYIDIGTMNNLLGERNVITGVLLDSGDEVTSKLRDVKNIRQVESKADMINSLMEFMGMIFMSMTVLIGFGGALGFAIVYNISLISINERILEFSSLRVLGFNKSEIFRMITRENVLMTILGILLGIPVGYGMCAGLASSASTDLYSIPMMINVRDYMTAAFITICFIVIGQLATSRKIQHLNFMDALKNRAT